MNKVIFVILLLILPGCCTKTFLSNYNLGEKFIGVWRASNVEGAKLKISYEDDGVFLLYFENGENEWHGIGFLSNDKIIAIFRYTNVYEQGFVTFTLSENKILKYVSRNPDGSKRTAGYYFKE